MPKYTPIFYRSSTGETYPYGEYANHGYGGEKHHRDTGVVYKDLPPEGYPYTIVYEENKLPEWMRQTGGRDV